MWLIRRIRITFMMSVCKPLQRGQMVIERTTETSLKEQKRHKGTHYETGIRPNKFATMSMDEIKQFVNTMIRNSSASGPRHLCKVVSAELSRFYTPLRHVGILTVPAQNELTQTLKRQRLLTFMDPIWPRRTTTSCQGTDRTCSCVPGKARSCRPCMSSKDLRTGR